MQGDWGKVPPPPGAPPPPPGGGWQQPSPPTPTWQAAPQPAQLRPLGLGDVLDGMFRILTRNWRTFLIALGVILVPVNLLAALVQRNLGGGVGFVDAFRNPAAFEAAASAGPGLLDAGLAGLFGVATAVLVTPYLHGICCAVAADSMLHGGGPAPRQALASAGGRYWSLVGAFLLGYLAVALVLLPGGAVMGLGAATQNVPVVVIGALLLFPLALLALAAGLLLLLAAPAIVVERIGPLAGLRRSAQLMRQRYWPRAGTLVLAYVVTSVVGSILGIPFGLIGAAFGGVVGVVFTALGGILTGLLTTPLIASAVTLVYLDGRIRGEGLDIAAFAAGLEGPARPGPGVGGTAGW